MGPVTGPASILTGFSALTLYLLTRKCQWKFPGKFLNANRYGSTPEKRERIAFPHMLRVANKIETGKRPEADSNRMDRIDRIKKIADCGLWIVDWKTKLFVPINPQSEIRIPQFLILSILLISLLALQAAFRILFDALKA